MWERAPRAVHYRYFITNPLFRILKTKTGNRGAAQGAAKD